METMETREKTIYQKANELSRALARAHKNCANRIARAEADHEVHRKALMASYSPEVVALVEKAEGKETPGEV